MNVSLPHEQQHFVHRQVAAGRYRTASEVVRDGLRLLEEAEHRRLLEKWIYSDLTQEEEELLPQELRNRARAHFQGLVDEARQEVTEGRLLDGPEAMARIRERLEKRRR